ncbi:response regulator transcription factor [Vibrio penaeicida]|uniref:response regulator transcription factor n=1 Tax=Vibrio penaeicida TaxID=104609 RepID=UPI0027342992|nr:response regulator transcription factor [Vibrio penaeicida]MDP2572754.1 response regulator transcription factor [Vibrio penaeicida]
MEENEPIASFSVLRKAIQGISNPPVVLALTHASENNRRSIFEEGFTDYISYPIVPEEVIRRVSAIKYMPAAIQTPPLSKKEILVTRAISILKSRLDEDITLGQLSQELSSNRNTLSEAFKDIVGQTIFSWLREQRLQKGAELLEKTELNVTHISLDVGYNNANNFSSAFKQHFNLTPLQYRKHRLKLRQEQVRHLMPQSND